MADEIAVGSQVQEPATNNVASPAPTTTTSFSTEEMMPKSRVNDLVHERTREAAQKSYEKGRAEALAEHQRQQSASFSPQSMGGMAMDENKIRQMMAEEFNRHHETLTAKSRQESENLRITNLANDVMGKIQAAKDRFPDLEKRVDEIAAFSELVPFANATDDAAGVIADLLDNPQKIGPIILLAQRSPNLALSQMQKLAASIKQNEAGKRQPTINEPLSHISHSTIAMADSGSNTVEDLKQHDWLRG